MTILKQLYISTGSIVSSLDSPPVGFRNEGQEVLDDTVRFCGGEGAGAGGRAFGAAVAQGAAAAPECGTVLGAQLLRLVLLVEL